MCFLPELALTRDFAAQQPSKPTRQVEWWKGEYEVRVVLWTRGDPTEVMSRRKPLEEEATHDV